jgi:hypothetical protein
VAAPVDVDAAAAASWTPEPDVRWAPGAAGAAPQRPVGPHVRRRRADRVARGRLGLSHRHRGSGLAVVALRRPWESRAVAVWALCLSLLSLAYSAGWLWWASTQGPLFG